MNSMSPTLLDHLYEKRRLALPTRNGFIFLRSEDILYARSHRGNCLLSLFKMPPGDEVLLSLSELENQLPKNRFCRIHESYLINIGHVTRYIKGNGGHVIMADDTELPVARQRKSSFINISQVC